MHLQGWRPFRRRGPQDAEGPSQRAEESAASTANGGPPLMLLVPDAVGLSSFRPHTFAGVESAVEFIQYWYAPGVKHGIVAFWALHGKPELGPSVQVDRLAEVVVLIRDPARPGVVYPFSFVDMESAQAFLRLEARRGLNPGHVAVYWAAPVTIEPDDLGVARLSPEAPPPTVQGKPPAEPASHAESTVMPAKETESDAAKHSARRLVTRSNGQTEPLTEAEPVLGLETGVLRAEDVGPVGGADAAGFLMVQSDGWGESLAKALAALEETREEAEDSEEATETDEEMDAAGLLTDQCDSPVEPTTEVCVEGEEAVEGLAEEEPAGECEEERADETTTEEMPSELGKALRMRRWRAPEGPFKGFGSPPGKF